METAQRFILALLFMSSWAAAIDGAEHLKYKDPKQPLNVRLDDLLSRMTLTEKIGQMAQIEQTNASSEAIKNKFIGSVLLEEYSVPFPQAPASAWVDMVNEVQRAALSTRLGIPVMYGIDAIHGHNTVYNATIFPHNVGLGVTRDPALVKKIGAATALEVRATCIPYSFAPCIAVLKTKGISESPFIWTELSP